MQWKTCRIFLDTPNVTERALSRLLCSLSIPFLKASKMKGQCEIAGMNRFLSLLKSTILSLVPLENKKRMKIRLHKKKIIANGNGTVSEILVPFPLRIKELLFSLSHFIFIPSLATSDRLAVAIECPFLFHGGCQEEVTNFAHSNTN